MLSKRTTFVLGAGASAEFGFPLGKELQLSIQAGAQRNYLALSGQPLNSLNTESHPVVRDMMGIGHDRNVILEALARIGNGLSLAGSIDTFLYNNRHNQAVIDCGKFFILRSIVHAERKSPLFNEEYAKTFCERLQKLPGGSGRYGNPHGVPWSTIALGESYMAPIWREISAPHGLEDISRLFENVAFVNFNYDRSLEASLLHAICGTFGLSQDAALSIIDKAEIVRPYGCPHGHGAFSSASLGFGESENIQSADALVNFRTFTETVDERVADKAKTLVGNSNILVFLGFAFHPQNLDLLQVRDCAEKKVFFSHYGDSDENRDALRIELSERLGPQRGPSVKISRSDIHGWIGTSVETLTRLGQGIFRSR